MNGIYGLKGNLENRILSVQMFAAPPSACAKFIQLLPLYGLNVNSAQVYQLGTIDEESMKCNIFDSPIAVAWSTVDYESQLPDTTVKNLKNHGVIPSDNTFVTVDSVNKSIQAINARLDNLATQVQK